MTAMELNSDTVARSPHNSRAAEETRLPAQDVRWEKVLQLRSAIAEGRYHVSSEDLADKLIGRLQPTTRK